MNNGYSVLGDDPWLSGDYPHPSDDYTEDDYSEHTSEEHESCGPECADSN